MKYKFTQLSDDLQVKFWTYPALITVLAITILISTLIVDHSLAQFSLWQQYVNYSMKAIDIRNILTTIIGAIITVTSVTLSITVLTLSIAGHQLGPRLLPNFIRQGHTQLSIGVFLGVFIYCLLLLVLSANNSFADKPVFVSLYIGVILTIFAFFVLIYFIHYVCNAIQVDYVLEYISNDTKQTMRRLFPEQGEFEPNQVVLARPMSKPMLIKAFHEGYIQSIDYDKLAALASTHDAVIDIVKTPGQFIFKDMVIGKVYEANDSDKMEQEINRCIRTGRKRTTVQDVEFGLDQISEVALKALSPGINNPYTAIMCIHKIGELLAFLSKRHIDEGFIADKLKLRLLYVNYTYEGICGIALAVLREHAFTQVNVTIEILRMIREVQALSPPHEMYKALDKHADILLKLAESQNYHQKDLDDIKAAYQQKA